MSQSQSLSVEKVTQDSGYEGQYLTFRLDGEMYAFSIDHVKEILEYQSVTQVPMMPDFIQGVINLRGEVVPVLNLARRFSLDATDVTKKTCIVILEVNTKSIQQVIGVVVDSVSEVLEIAVNEMRPAPNFGTTINTDFIQSMARYKDGFVIILDQSQVMSAEQLVNLVEVSHSLSDEIRHDDTTQTD
jgi:purine-binding chemotaxis protein CheW